MSYLSTWFVPGEGITGEVIRADIQRYLGPDASVTTGELNGVQGYITTAYRGLTPAMLEDLRNDSARWEAEKQQNRRNNSYIQSPPEVASVPRLSSANAVTTSTNARDSYLEWIAENCGWQIEAEKFLWHERSITTLEVTEKGRLGRGSIGEVEEVRVRGNPLTMARKRVHISRWKEQAARELKIIQDEIMHLKTLVHPHIVKVLGCYEAGQGTRNRSICALMYPVGDNDLGTFLYEECKDCSVEDGERCSQWISKWFHCLTSALAYMHSEHIHHEDIKPSNIIHRGDHVFFTDFSSSRKFEAGQETSTASPALASRMFAAPEALRNLDGDTMRHGSKTDVFSLGLVFAEMYNVLIGRDIGDFRTFLFGEQTEFRQYHRAIHQFTAWFWNSGGGRFYEGCISLMLRENRHERPSAKEVSHLLQPYYLMMMSGTDPRCRCEEYFDYYVDGNVDGNVDGMDWELVPPESS